MRFVVNREEVAMTNQKLSLASVALLALTLMPTVAAGQDFKDLKSNGNLQLRGYGSFFIPGTTHEIDAATATGGGYVGRNFPGGCR